jgi:hypothetical protein
MAIVLRRSSVSARMKVTAMAVTLFFYPSLVEDILSIFSCKEVCLITRVCGTRT